MTHLRGDPEARRGGRGFRNRDDTFSSVPWAIGVLAGTVLAAAVSYVVVHSLYLAEPSPEALAVERATEFLDRYVTRDGRVVRLDQGGDTVSEGQGYGMLLAVVADDEDRFEAIWSWTRDELQRDDGLLAWHWQDGAVTDDMPASDADLEVAWALLLAADRFSRPDWRDEALTIADAILDTMTVRAGRDRILAAGPWALDDPVIVNPSYLVPGAFEALGETTGDDRWHELWHTSRRVLTDLTAGGRLPPDWVQLSPTGLQPVGTPEGGGNGRYGLDAARVPLRLASACDMDDRALAADLWPTLAELEDDGARTAYDLSGQPDAEGIHPLGLFAAASAAAAAGDAASAHARLVDGERLSDFQPSYYGQAWAALARTLLTTALLTDCPGPLPRV